MSAPASRVIFVNRFYWPEEPATAQLLADLSQGLAARGRSVTVIASGPAGSPVRATHAGVAIIRVRRTPWATRNLLGRAWDFAAFHLRAGWALGRELRRGETVVALTDPPLIGVTVWLVARLRRARVWHWTQDVYPEVAHALARRWSARALLALLRPLRNLAWRQSAGCAVLGRDMAALVRGAGVSTERIAIVPNWPPAGLGPADGQALRAAWGLKDKFVVAYSGNLGRVHALDGVLALADALRDRPEIVFVFIGGGAQRTRLAAAADALELRNVRFFPAQPREQLAATLAVGDVHLITLRAGCQACVFPSKFYGIAAAGRPILFLGPPDCELADLIGRHGLGAVCAPEDTTTAQSVLAHWISNRASRTASGAAALQFASKQGGYTGAVEAWETYLSN